jgi:hypothetical protein
MVAIGSLMAGSASGQPTESKASIRGIVSDSLVSGGPLVGALVELLEVGRSVMTDQRGVFRFDSLPGGRYTVSFSHPSLTAIGFTPPDRVVQLGSGIDVQVTLATPAPITLYQRFCRGLREEKTGVLLGTLTNAVTAQPLVGGEVRGEWIVTTLSRESGFSQRPRLVRAAADSTGRFVLCGVPTDVPVLLRTIASGTEGPALDLRLEGKLFQVRHLSLDPTGAGGRARVIGKVTAAGTALADAQVLMLGSTAITKTRADGSFEITGLAAGSYTLEARAIGYGRQRIGVELRPDHATEVALALTKLAVELPELSVRAPAATSGFAGFDHRRRASIGGYFITRDEIIRRGTVRVEDVFRTVPGMRLLQAGLTDFRIVSTRGGTGFSAECEPTVFIDDTRLPLDPETGLTLPLAPEEVHGIEVYQGPSSAPLQYRAFGQNCGIILIWTRRGQR